MAFGTRKRPYQRRRVRPWASVVAVLAVVAIVTWTVVLVSATGPAGATECPAPAAAPPPGEVLPADALDTVAPAPPSAVRVRALNAGGQRGQANLVAAQLGDLGFTEAQPPDNDPFFPEGDMECVGQLRFGPAGEAAAATLAIVMPCTELVRDGREDDSVDVAVGTEFSDVNPGRAARDVLDQLAGGGSDGSGNVAGADGGTAPPVVDPDLLEQARSTSC